MAKKGIFWVGFRLISHASVFASKFSFEIPDKTTMIKSKGIRSNKIHFQTRYLNKRKSTVDVNCFTSWKQAGKQGHFCNEIFFVYLFVCYLNMCTLWTSMNLPSRVVKIYFDWVEYLVFYLLCFQTWSNDHIHTVDIILGPLL
jgi:hypothetical protein